jgi:very-short-patch-repair endonuclease
VDSPHDAVRDKWLVSRNYRVMRFWNNDVLTNMSGVLEAKLSLPRSPKLPLTQIADAI